MNHTSLKIQWAQLLLLTWIHFFVDMFAGMVPALLPAVRKEFAISAMIAWWLITVLSLVSNGVQIMVGHLRSDKTTVFFLPMGVILAASMCTLGLLPTEGQTAVWLFLVIIVYGIGNAVVHPEGIRAIHTIKTIAPSTCTAVFTTGGILGYGGGAWLSTELFTRWGFSSLWVFAPIALVVVAAIYGLKLSLAPEEGPLSDHGDPGNKPVNVHANGLAFWPVWLMAIPACIAIVAVMGFLPTRLNELKFSLEYGGRANMLFVCGAAVGTLFWGALSRKHDDIRVSTLAIFLGTIPMAVYLNLMNYRMAILLLAPAGFCVMGAYPMMVNAARFARGMNLGARMALIMGGIWGTSGIVFLFLGKLAEYWTIEQILNWTCLGYLLSVIVGFRIIRKTKISVSEANTTTLHS